MIEELTKECVSQSTPSDSGESDRLTEDVTAVTDVTPQHILSLAKRILFGLAIIFVISMVIECIYPDNAVFEACKVVLPSLATLVIGYYFGTTK